MKKILDYLILIFIGRFVLDLFLSNELAYLIHPRYILFTLFASIVAISVGLAGVVFNFQISAPKQKRNNAFVILFKLLVIGILIYLPNYQINPLSSATFSQRSLDLNSLNIDDIESSELGNFVRNTENISLGEWVKAINLNPNLDDYAGRKVRVSGFVYVPDNSQENMFMISRFIVTCCAVDARPVGLWVDPKESYESDQWLEVVGKFEIRKLNNEAKLVIVPDQINKIEVPDQPYIV